MRKPPLVVVASHWYERRSELAFVTRSIAGAASRSGGVALLVPSDVDGEADGAFDLEGLQTPGGLQWPDGLWSDAAVIVDELTPDIADLLGRTGATGVFFLSATEGSVKPGWQHLELVVRSHPIGVHVPVNHLAERHRHHGFGFTDYLLVLSDRSGDQAEPPQAAAWLSSAFNDADVVVVEDAVASAWKGRSLRGRVPVDTRMDLWRLVAHAKVCVDLAPGPFLARECVEALRFGTPIIVPERSGPATVHAQASGGSTFGDPGELVTAVGAFESESTRSATSLSGRLYADGLYGDPAAFVARMRELVEAA